MYRPEWRMDEGISVAFHQGPEELDEPTVTIKTLSPSKDDLESSTEDEANDQAALIPITQEDDDTLQLSKKQESTSSIGGASFNFINSIIGSGIIGIPYALQQSGFLVGLLLLIIAGLATDYTVMLLIRNGILANQFTYQDMVTVAFGRPGYWFLTFAQFVVPFTAMISYTVIVGDTLTRVLQQLVNLLHLNVPNFLIGSQMIKLVVTLCVMLPISLLRNISKLEKFSTFAVICITFIVGVTIYEATQLYCAVRCFQPECCDSPFSSWGINNGILPAFGIMTGAFTCHHNTYLVFESLKQHSHTRFSTVSHISVFVSFLFCSTLGLAGFITFMSYTQGDLLNNYCVYSPLANTTRFFYTCVIMLTYPIECFVAREVMEIALTKSSYALIKWIPIQSIRKRLDHFLFTPVHKSLVRHVLLTLLIVGGVLGIGVTTNKLGVLMAFTGCFTAVPLAYILPTASYLKLSQRPWCSRSKLVALLVLVFGIIVMVLGTVQAAVQLVASYSYQQEYSPDYCRDPGDLDTCCQLSLATANFTLSVPLCDCSALCTHYSYFVNSSNFSQTCLSRDDYFTN